MRIRNAVEQDLPRIMQIYAMARSFMAAHGNPNQWGPTNWPPESLIVRDIQTGCCYVCLNDRETIVGTFYYKKGDDETYRVIEEGSWRDTSAYGVVHRIAGDGSQKGIGAFCIHWAFEQCGHLKMDTHGDNLVMQNLLAKLGFEKRGIIHVVEDGYPRIAYEK